MDFKFRCLVAFAFISSLKMLIKIKVDFDELPHSKFLQIFFLNIAARQIDVNTDHYLFILKVNYCR